MRLEELCIVTQFFIFTDQKRIFDSITAFEQSHGIRLMDDIANIRRAYYISEI